MQENTQVATTPPLSGADLVAQINKALQTIATDFAGDIDPAATAWPFCTWADTVSGLLKRRNDAGTAWIAEGALFEYKANRNGDAFQFFKAAPSSAANHAVVQSQVFGVGQIRQDLTSSRFFGTNYPNATGKSIEVKLRAIFTGIPQATVSMTFNAGGDTRSYFSVPISSSGVAALTLGGMVLPGEEYSASYVGNVDSYRWGEIRT